MNEIRKSNTLNQIIAEKWVTRKRGQHLKRTHKKQISNAVNDSPELSSCTFRMKLICRIAMKRILVRHGIIPHFISSWIMKSIKRINSVSRSKQPPDHCHKSVCNPSYFRNKFTEQQSSKPRAKQFESTQNDPSNNQHFYSVAILEGTKSDNWRFFNNHSEWEHPIWTKLSFTTVYASKFTATPELASSSKSKNSNRTISFFDIRWIRPPPLIQN